MTRLIDDLLLLSRVEMRAHVLPREKADLVLAASEAIKQTTQTAQREGTTVTTAFAAAPVTIPGDHDELVQAVQNLLSNAIKYGKPGGRIDVRIEAVAERRGGTAWKLSVADDGPGIAPEHLPRLTERFYRVSTAESRQKGGTGLGLAIVKHIVLRHRGRVEVESMLGRGTTVSLIFPTTPGI
jgi:two-component system phosphate regulon sensor histidine kinase PhoR